MTPEKDQVDTTRAEHIGQVLELYLRGKTPRNIAGILGIPDTRVRQSLSTFKTDYLSTLSINGIIPRYENLGEALNKINEPFYLLMSRSDEPLSNEEMVYCALYVATGNSLKAIKESGLDAGLQDQKGTEDVYQKNCVLRSEVVKRKSNIKVEIRRLQLEREEHQDITQDKLVTMHMAYLEQLQEEGDPKNKSLIVKLFDQIAKMTGAYNHVIKTQEISADDVMDGMMAEMEKAEADIKAAADDLRMSLGDTALVEVDDEYSQTLQ